MIRKFRTALVGLGRIGSSYADDPLTCAHYRYASHAQVLAKHPAFAWEAAVDPDQEVLAKAQTRWGFAYGAASIADLLVDYQPEVLVLATPPSAYAATVAACPGLKALLCEKPLGVNRIDARAFLDLCDEREILVQVNYWRRCDTFYRRLAAGELANLIGDRQAVSGLYGNGLINNGSHLVDFCRMMFGEIVSVSAFGPALHRKSMSFAGDFDVGCMLGLADGTVVVLQPLDFNRYREIGLDIWGDIGRLELLNEGLTNRLSKCAPHRALSGASEILLDLPQCLPATVGDALYNVYDNLAAALLGNGQLLSPASSAWCTALVIDAIERAVKADDGCAQAVDTIPLPQ